MQSGRGRGWSGSWGQIISAMVGIWIFFLLWEVVGRVVGKQGTQAALQVILWWLCEEETRGVGSKMKPGTPERVQLQ